MTSSKLYRRNQTELNPTVHVRKECALEEENCLRSVGAAPYTPIHPAPARGARRAACSRAMARRHGRDSLPHHREGDLSRRPRGPVVAHMLATE
jgi:hypothetical protein